MDEEDDETDSDDDDVYGIISLISLSDKVNEECIKQIKNILLSRIPKDNNISVVLKNTSVNVGLVVNERFVNLPPKISLPSYQQLLNDLKTAKEIKNNPDFKLSWFLIVCKIKKMRESKQKKVATSGETIIYINAEDEIFDEFAEHKYEYSVADQCDDSALGGDWEDDQHLFEPFRKILLLSTDNYYKAIDRLENEFK